MNEAQKYLLDNNLHDVIVSRTKLKIPYKYASDVMLEFSRTTDTRVIRALENIKDIMYVIDSENINIRSKPIMQDLNEIKEILEGTQ